MSTLCSTYGGPSYTKALDKLDKDFEASFGYKKQRQIFENFAQKYTTIPEVWNKWIGVEADYNKKPQIVELRKRALTHFYSLDFIGFLRPDTNVGKDFSKIIEWPYMDILRYKCYNNDPKVFADGLKLAEAAVQFPHNKLDEVYRIYCSKTRVDEVIRTNYQYSKYLYNLLLSASNDCEKWFRFLCMGRSPTFIIQNIEYKICKTPWDIKLWRLYINYLKESNTTKALDVYSKACRFFVDNKELLAEYRFEIQRMYDAGMNVFKWICDTIEFECDFGSVFSAYKLVEKALYSTRCDLQFLQYVLEFGKKHGFVDIDVIHRMIYDYQPNIEDNNEQDDMDIDIDENEDFSSLSTFHKPWGQNWSIPTPIIFHVLKNANHELLLNLFSSCKALFSRFRVFLCHRLYIHNTLVNGYSPLGSTLKLSLDNLFNFYVTNALTVVSDNRSLLLWLRVVLYRCDVSVLNITGQDVSFEVFKFFINENVKHISLHDCSIIGDNNQSLAVHEIINLFPNAEFIQIGPGIACTAETSRILSELRRPTRLKFFEMRNLPANFSHQHFAEFVKNNALADTTFQLHFVAGTNENVKHDFLMAVKNELRPTTLEQLMMRINVF